jgi:hypothetical protein
MTPMVKIPWHARAILLRPAAALRNLEAIEAAGIVEQTPNLWQLELGVMRMWHRILFRSDTIGLSQDHGLRPGWRARLFQYRPIRFPFLLWEGSVVPWDLSGLLSTPARLMRHVLGTHHEGVQFVYDLNMLAVHPGALETLREETRAVVTRDDARSRWLRDLCVYEQYHETLLGHVEHALAEGFREPADRADDPDLTFPAFLRWCASQPSAPLDTWRAWRRGEFGFAPAAA